MFGRLAYMLIYILLTSRLVLYAWAVCEFEYELMIAHGRTFVHINLERMNELDAIALNVVINRQWRICFTWSDDPGPTNVEIVDYH